MQTLSDNFIAFIPRLQIFVAGSPGVEVTIIGVVKKTFRYSNVFFYNPLCRTSIVRNIIMEIGIIALKQV